MNHNEYVQGQYKNYNQPPPNYNNYNQPPPNYNQPPPNYNNYNQPPPNYNHPPPNYIKDNLRPPNYNQPSPNYINYNMNQPPNVIYAAGRDLSVHEENEDNQDIKEGNTMYQSSNTNPRPIEHESDGPQKKCIACAETYIPDMHCIIPNFCMSCGKSVILGEGMKHKIVSKARCKVCHAIFATHYALHQHQDEFNHMFNCRICGKKFHKVKQLISHLPGCKRNKKRKNRQRKKGIDVEFVQEFNANESPPLIDITEDVKYESSMELQPSRFSIDRNSTVDMSGSVNVSNIDDDELMQTSSHGSKKKPNSKASQKPEGRNRSGVQEAEGKRKTARLDNDEVATLTCNCCSKKFDTKHGLHLHAMLVKATIKCDACGKIFNSKHLYNQHACMFSGHVASDHVANIWLSERNKEWTPGKNLVWVAPNKSFVPGRNRVWVRGQNDTSNTDG